MIGNIYQCKREPRICSTYFTVLDAKDNKEIKPYIFSATSNSAEQIQSSSFLMDGSRGTYFAPTFSPVTVHISAKGYSTSNIVIDPFYGNVFDLNPPKKVYLNRQ